MTGGCGGRGGGRPVVEVFKCVLFNFSLRRLLHSRNRYRDPGDPTPFFGGNKKRSGRENRTGPDILAASAAALEIRGDER